MKLTQHPTFKNFYHNAGTKLAVFSASTAAPEFDLATAFDSTAFDFIVFFFKTDTPDFDKVKVEFSSIIAAGIRKILWLDEFTAAGARNAQVIDVMSKSNVVQSYAVVFGNTDNQVLIARNDNKATIKFVDGNLNILVSGGKEHTFLAHNTTAAESMGVFTSAVIPLSNLSTISGTKTSIAKNFGSFCFTAVKPKNGTLVQPTIPFIQDDKGEMKLRSYHFFEHDDYGRNSQLVVTLFPYDSVSNDKNDFSSFMETVRSTPVNTNIPNEFAKKTTTVFNNGNFVSRLSFTEVLEFDQSTRNFFFIPEGGQKLQIGHEAKNTLLGFSGTERVGNNMSIEFRESKNVRYDDSKVQFVQHGNSKTVFTALLNKTNYHTDSEKSPLFDNVKTAGEAPTREVAYNAVSVSTIENIELPFIPTFSFKGRMELLELEKAFSKYRIKQVKAAHLAAGAAEAVTKQFVTPQGFLRNAGKLDFIKAPKDQDKDNKKIRAKDRVKNKADLPFQFSVNGVTATSDFNLSLCREDVFFVLTPRMLKDKLEEIIVFFELKKFKIDLDVFTAGAETDDTIIIFKFSKRSFIDLLNDRERWSNFGDYKPADYKQLIDNITSKSAFPNNPEYAYFNNTIKVDPKWNGVVVLNIPLKPEQLPPLFDGLSSSQVLEASTGTANPGEKLQFKTGLRFQYIAFPVNKTGIEDGSVAIRSTSFYGIIDYDLLNKPDGSVSEDYKTVSKHFADDRKDIDTYKFLLTKLLVRFENSEIRNFKSFAFLQIPNLFENDVEFDKIKLEHDIPASDMKPNLIRLDGQYQKNSAGNDEFNFSAKANLVIKFRDGNLLDNITVTKIGFSFSEGTNEYRFDIDAKAGLGSWSRMDLFSVDDLHFQNIGLKFSLNGLELPKIHFDLSRLLVFPKISFNGKGLLSSFPIRFSHFEVFKLTKKSQDEIEIEYDYFTFPGFEVPDIGVGKFAQMFSFIFDFDLGTLGNLGALKALKGKLCLGWTLKKGFAIGIKLDGPSSDGLHLNLFGALKLDIMKLEFCKIGEQFLIRILDARLKIFSINLPPEDKTFSAVIFAKPGEKIAWLMSYVKGTDPNPLNNKLLLGIGQRVGINGLENMRLVKEGIKQIKNVFNPEIKVCGQGIPPFYHPERNWLIGSEALLPEKWPLELQFIFNDPVLYGIHLGFKNGLLAGFNIDILYKKISENLGVYSTEIQLPDAIRSHDTGGAYFRLPNIGIDIYTNGDWKTDIGFPRTSDDWSRSGFLQLRTVPPFVGWFGFYLMRSRTASLTLFKGFIDDAYSSEHLNIIQAGFAMRVGLGAYIDGGIFYVGASITLYGVLEGAFAFENQTGLASMFPDHFAIMGRVGAIAELVGYVDFFILKASIRISLRAEFGLLLVYLSKPGNVLNPSKPNQGTGIQPVNVYIEGEVNVKVSIKIGCVRINLSFRAFVRFEYTIGGGGSSQKLASKQVNRFQLKANAAPKEVLIDGIADVPIIYMPVFSKINESGSAEQLLMLHSFSIPFFGLKKDGDRIVFSKKNFIKNKVLQPFFNNLITGLNTHSIAGANTYETLRAVLIGNEVKSTTGADVKINIRLPKFRPVFIKGINSTDKETVVKILKNYFLLDDSEIDLGLGPTCKPIIDSFEHALIPAPVVGKVMIADADGASLHQTTEKFALTVKGLVSGDVTSTIRPIMKKESDLQYMEAFYDDYKTQYLDRSNKLAKETDPEHDIRENVIVPEFFTLAALLTLETFFNKINPKQKSGEAINPAISVDNDGIFHYEYNIKNDDSEDETVTGTWDPKDSLEDIIGQLNYFYNSGLRLPEVAAAIATKAIYTVLEQQETITPLSIANPDPATVSILLDNQDITSEVYGEASADRNKNIRDMWTFISRFGTPDFLKKLRDEFDEAGPKFTQPFSLLPVTLGVQTGRLNIESNGVTEGRFFELPAKLSQHGALSSLYSYNVKFADVKETTDAGSVTLIVANCLNVEVKIRRHTNRVLEIVNVYSDELNLINTLHRQGFAIDGIDLYYKPVENDPKQPVKLQRLINAVGTILKTNLSPRTSPPLFEALAKERKEENKEDQSFWEDSNKDRKHFIKLLWEAVTANTGGYFIVLDKDFDATLPEGSTEETMIVSFSTASAQVPRYFNCFRLPFNKDVFDKLDAKTHYLYLDKISLDGKAVQEYHPVIPAHSFGFEMLRDRKKNTTTTKSNYLQYLPLEFNLQESGGQVILDKQRILPIMPTSVLDENGKPVEDQYKYEHISPLNVMNRTVTEDNLPAFYAEQNNVKRYETVGKKYKLEYDIRDVHGYRIAATGEQPIGSATYTHFYFDKLVPAESWPLTKLSYWFEKWDPAKKILTWKVSCNSDIREILDLAAIERIGKDFKYKLGDAIEDDDIEKLKLIIPGVLNSLYTILAQLTDARTVVKLSNYKGTEPVKEELRKKIESITLLLQSIKETKKMPATNVVATDAFVVETIPADSVKNLHAISISISRPVENTLATKEAAGLFGYDEEVISDPDQTWEFATTHSCESEIAHLNPANNAKSSVQDLNDAVRLGTKLKFDTANPNDPQKVQMAAWSLGISSNSITQKRVLFVVNEAGLSQLKAENTDAGGAFDEKKCYFGIRPFSNKLFSGEYSPQVTGLASEVFTNIDLDKSLRIVLNKVDELLQANFISAQVKTGQDAEKNLFEQLIAAKKQFAKTQLKEKLDWVMQEQEVGDAIKTEFGNLLLERLNNFYDYDGVMSTGITTPIDLSGNRLTLSLDGQTGFKLVSSKIDESRKWSVLFDQREGTDVSFEVLPRVTHIEFDITPATGSEEIEHSTWIQLIRSVQFENSYNVTGWHRIIREFPDKPVILQHSADQKFTDGQPQAAEWNIEELGKWIYHLEIKDTYQESDHIKGNITLATQAAKLSKASAGIESFIAYWAARIISQGPAFDWKPFVTDLHLQFSTLAFRAKEVMPKKTQHSFELRKIGASKWKIEDPASIPGAIISFFTNDSKPHIKIGDFNVFKTGENIISVQVDVRVVRNSDIKNEEFIYETEKVEPASPATPHIKYFNRILLREKTFEEKVFTDEVIANPYKSTARFYMATGDVADQDTPLPSLPLQQIECTQRSRPTVMDDLFKEHSNGHPSFSLTVYNKSTNETELPVFYADAIYKD